MISKRLLRTLVLVLLIIAPALGQEEGPATTQGPPDAGAARQELKQKALDLLEDVIKDSELFRHAENRLRIRAAAAQVLWDHDPARARLLFKEVMAGLADLIDNQEAGGETEQGPLMSQGARQLRRELLQTLAQRDPRLARELLRTTRAAEPGGRVPRGDVLADRPLELNLATQIAETDPNQALEMAEQSLDGGLSYELPGVLSALQVKDPAAAAKLAGQIVVRLRAEKLGESDVAKSVAVSLLRMVAQPPDEEEKAPKNAAPLLDAQATHELIEKLAEEALRPNTTSPEIIYVLNEMMPVVEKYAPARAAQVKRKAASAGGGQRGVPELPVDWGKYQTLLQQGSVEELLAAAAGAPEEVRESFYLAAAAKLREAGDMGRARQIINEHVSDPAQRKHLLADLDEQAAFEAAARGQMEETRKMLSTLRTNEERVLALVRLAEGATAKGDKKQALMLLDEAREMTGERAKTSKQFLAQLAVARAYVPLDPSRSLAMLEPAVDQLNELLAAGVVLGGFFAEELVRDDEIMMEQVAGVARELFTAYPGDLTTLAGADFERTRALAERFQRPEIRTLARLIVAQSVLTPRPAVTVVQHGSVMMGGRMQ